MDLESPSPQAPAPLPPPRRGVDDQLLPENPN